MSRSIWHLWTDKYKRKTGLRHWMKEFRPSMSILIALRVLKLAKPSKHCLKGCDLRTCPTRKAPNSSVKSSSHPRYRSSQHALSHDEVRIVVGCRNSHHTVSNDSWSQSFLKQFCRQPSRTKGNTRTTSVIMPTLWSQTNTTNTNNRFQVLKKSCMMSV